MCCGFRFASRCWTLVKVQIMHDEMMSYSSSFHEFSIKPYKGLEAQQLLQL
jgi:hypothetical protein